MEIENKPQPVNHNSEFIARTALLSVIAIICALTWHKWGSLIIDCGHEMYIPAALSAGKRLYFDVWYPYGPLIPYWHALLFRMFGVHLWLLETAGIAIATVMTLLIYSLSRKFLPVSLSFAAAFAFIVQAFQLSYFNYVLPYSYPAAYGALMFVMLAWFVVRDCFDEKPWTMFAAGSIAALEAITKIEFGMAAYILVAGAFVVRVRRSRSIGLLAKDAAFCLPGLLLCAGVYGWYIRASGVAFMFEQNITLLPGSYFVKTIGSRWLTNIGFTTSPVLIAQAALLGLLGLAIAAAAVRIASSSRRAGLLVAAAALLVCTLPVLAPRAAKAFHRPLPPLLSQVAPFVYFNSGMVLVAAAFALWTLARWRKAERGRQEAALLLFTAAIAMGFRTLIGAQPAAYSIYYDTIAFVAFLVALRALARRFGAPDSRRLWMWTSALLCCGLVSLTIGYYPVHRRSHLISSSAGSAYMEPAPGETFSQTLAFLNEAATQSKKFVIWPEEVAFYFFTGTIAPSRWWYVLPGIVPPGEPTSRYLDDLDRQGVEYVVLSNRNTPEYGFPVFGVDYNRQMHCWLQENFSVIRTFGDYQRVAYPPQWAEQIWQRKHVPN